MSYIGNKPANKAVVASDLDPAVITGQTALAVAPADTDEFLISDAGTLKRLDASLIGGGSLVKLHSVTTTDANTTNIDFTSTYITTTYDNYLVLGKVKVATDDAECRVRFSESGTFQDGASYYGIGMLNEGAGSTNDNDISYMTLDTGGAGNASGEGASFNATFFNLRDSSIFSCMNFIRTNINADNFHSMQVGSGGTDAAADHDGIRFYLSSGNFASGTTITLYGYEK